MYLQELLFSGYTIDMGKIILLKKNPCSDCSFCQYCSETRCNMCRQTPGKKKKKTKEKIHKPLFRPY